MALAALSPLLCSYSARKALLLFDISDPVVLTKAVAVGVGGFVVVTLWDKLSGGKKAGRRR